MTWPISVFSYLGAALTAVSALGMWQYQLITKRRYEVIEGALTVLGEAVEALHYIRRAEIDSKLMAEQHTGEIFVTPTQVINQRIHEKEEIFCNLDSTVNLITVHFGRGSTKNFSKLQKIYRDVRDNATKLYFRSPAEKLYATLQKKTENNNTKAIIFSSDAKDEININKLLHDIEEESRHYIRPNLFRLFVPWWAWRR